MAMGGSHTRKVRVRTLAACVLASLGSTALDPLAHAGALGSMQPPSLAASASLRVYASNPASPKPATTISVENCNDAGMGSLRQALLDAFDGDVIDLTGLSCSTITLTTGALDTGVEVTLQGPGEAELTIDGNGMDRVLYSSGPSLSISGVTLANGYLSAGIGGCLLATGDVTLTHTTITGCVVGSGGASGAYGAGIASLGNLTAISSTITGNTATAGGRAAGAGIYTIGTLTLVDSTVSDNVAAGQAASGGGIFVNWGFPATIETSVIERNAVYASNISAGGGVYGGTLLTIKATQLSGNLAQGDLAGC